MSLGLTNNQPATNGFSLGASAYSAPAAQAPPTVGQSFSAGILGGAGVNPQYMTAPMTPPSETEILNAMLQTLQPIDRFIIS